MPSCDDSLTGHGVLEWEEQQRSGNHISKDKRGRDVFRRRYLSTGKEKKRRFARDEKTGREIKRCDEPYATQLIHDTPSTRTKRSKLASRSLERKKEKFTLQSDSTYSSFGIPR